LRESLQEAQLPQRNSASAVHVWLGIGWLTDRVMHRSRRIADLQHDSRIVVSTFNSISQESVRNTWPMKFSNIIYPHSSFKVNCFYVIRKALRSFAYMAKSHDIC